MPNTKVTEKELEQKIKKCIDFVKKECPECYEAVLKCCDGGKCC